MDAAIKKNRQIANCYYNLGLEKAGYRDLTGAIASLKRCLQFYKFHTDARNLLGLIYNEMGEVAAALTQWVISINLDGENNLAEEYLSKVHGSRGYLEMADQAAKKYNQALIYAQNDNADLAVLLLMRMLAELPNYVRAQQLLALLYIQHEDYTKAGRCLYQSLKVDRLNTKSQRYMAIVKENTGRAEIEKRKLKNAFSHRQMEDDDIILPPTYKENTGWQSILNILAGLVLGAALVFFLVIRANNRMLGAEHNQEILRYSEMLNQKSIEINSLKAEQESAVEAKAEAEATLASLVSDNGGVISQYQNLIKILQAYRAEDLKTAALLYSDLDTAVLKDGAINDVVEWLEQDMGENGYQILLDMGTEALAQDEGVPQAIDYYQRSLKIKADNPQTIYQLGLAYKTQGDQDTANQYFGDVIMNYGSSQYAELAKQERGY